MSLKLWFLLLLFLVNAAVFLWPSYSNVASHIYVKQEELNPHFVRLNKEIEERFYSQASVTVVESGDADESAQTTATTSTIVSATTAAVSSSSVDSICYRLGPFLHKASYELAQAVLFNAGVDYQKSTRTSQSSDVYRLYLGEFDDDVQVADARLGLKQKKILDHFSRKLDSGKYIISLGIYSSQETAETALRLFSGKLDGVKMKSETVLLPDSHWMHFVLPKDSSMLEQLVEIEWGENSAKLGPHSCRTQ